MRLILLVVFSGLNFSLLAGNVLENARIEAEKYIDARAKILEGPAPNLARMLKNTFLNPIITTSQWQPDNSLYLITGSYSVVDPPMVNGTQVSECWLGQQSTCPYGAMKNSMWLRDAFGQWMPYFNLMQRAHVPNIEKATQGLLYMAAKQIGHSAYANAFKSGFEFSADQAGQGQFGIVSQNTYEPDSLMWVVWGAWKYAKTLKERGDKIENLFGDMDDFFVLEKIFATLKTETYRSTMQASPEDGTHQSRNCPRDYLNESCSSRDIKSCTEPGSPCRWIFDQQRNEAYCVNDSFQASYQQWALGGQGVGQPIGDANCEGSCALTWSAYRPSDDLNKYGYNIPINMMAIVTLSRIIDLVNWMLPYAPQKNARAESLLTQCKALGQQIEKGIQTYGIVNAQKNTTQIYAYETDALGNFDKIDDANIPSLLSMKYFGYEPDELIWNATYKFITSNQNQYYYAAYSGSNISGVGSCHTANFAGEGEGMVWPMATMIQAQIEAPRNPKRAAQLLHQVVHSTNDTYFMHESISIEDQGMYTRGWFAWANGLFAEIVDEWLTVGDSPVMREYFKLVEP